MSLGEVCALVGDVPGHPDLVAATQAALDAQQRPAEHVLAAAGDPVGGVERALATRAEWVWLLDGVTVPQSGALAALEAATGRLAGLPAPLVLASKVLADDGEMHPDGLPQHEIFEKQVTVDACERGLVQLRAVPSGSVLIRRTAFERFGTLRTDLPPSWSVFEFTARALQHWDDTGHLVPGSVAVRRVAARPAGRAGGGLRSRARMLSGSTWTTTERLWEAYQLAERTLRGEREPARRA